LFRNPVEILPLIPQFHEYTTEPRKNQLQVSRYDWVTVRPSIRTDRKHHFYDCTAAEAVLRPDTAAVRFNKALADR
jgi:hypothetical protein